MKLLPVIHIKSVEQAVRNALLSQDCGAHGCFLIHHSAGREELLDAYAAVREVVGDWWVGLNDLGRDGEKLLAGLPSVDGLWVDSLERNKDVKANFSGMLFGGTAFKYQKRVNDVAEAARDAARLCDVVTTSGEGTGSAPAVDKIRTMKGAIGDKPLAIASGITPENVREFLPYTDYFLVATGISSSFHELDAAKVRSLLSEMG